MTLEELGIQQDTNKVGVGYMPHYERHLSELHDKPITLLEIGVDRGYSLYTWESWMPKAHIIGVDIAPQETVNTGRVQTIVMDIKDYEPTEPLDIVIDDGSHMGFDVVCAFDILWPVLRSGGWYCIEDWFQIVPWSAPYEGAQDIAGSLLIEVLNHNILEPNASEVSELHAVSESTACEKAMSAPTPLCELAEKFGTNKAVLDYTPGYYSLLKDWTPGVLLELGIGAPGLSGGPSEHAASLYMWREFLPASQIIGLDIRTDLLFSAERISTYWADLYEPSTVEDVGLAAGPFDMIVDDAVHDPDIQLSALHTLWPFLRAGGRYCIEDLCPYKFPDGNWTWFLDLVYQGRDIIGHEISGKHDAKLIVIHKGE